MADKKNRNISNLPVAIPDVPDAPIVSATDVGTGRAFNNGAATVTFTPTTGGLPTSYEITTTPTTTTTTASSSPATITGLDSGTSYTTTVRPSNVSITGPIATTSSAFTATSVPQAPTIGTPTSVSTTSASVDFTPGGSGGKTVSSYTATSSPGSITASNTSSPITVTGLTPGQTYTFSVTATNANGTSLASSSSSSLLMPNDYYIARISGGTGITLYDNAIDSSDNLYFVGTYNDSSNIGVPDILVGKLDSNGALLWARRLGTSATSDIGYAIDLDSSNNVYIGGSATISGTALPLLAKYDSSGTIQWQRSLTAGGGSGAVYDIAVDSSGNSHIVSSNNNNSGDWQITKYDTSGNVTWQRTIKGSSNGTDQASGIDIDSSGNVYVSGYTADVSGVQIAKYDSSGTIQWQRYFTNATGTSEGTKVAVDSSGNMYIHARQGTSGLVLTKCNTSGIVQWQRLLDTGSVSGNSYPKVVVDTSANVYITNECRPTPGSNIGTVVAKYNSSGTLQWQRTFGVTNNPGYPALGYGISVNSAGIMYLVGLEAGYVYPPSFIVALPDDGSGTGNYGVTGFGFSYATSSFTDSSLSPSSGTTSGQAVTSSLTSSTSTLTESAATTSYTKKAY